MSSEYVYPEYEQSNTIKDWHNVPRFGQPDSFTQLESEDDVWQYVYGTLLVPGCFIALFVLFCCTSCKFTCCPGLCAREQEDTEEKKPSRFSAGFKRVAFMCTGLLATLVCALYPIFMMPDVLAAIDTVYDNSDIVFDILDGTRATLEGLRYDGFYARPVRDTLVEELPKFCPQSAAAEEAYGVNFEELTTSYSQDLETLEDFLYFDIPDIRENITTRAMNVTFMVDDRMDTATDAYNGVYFLLLGLAGLYFLLSTCTAFLGLDCIKNYRRGCAKGFMYPVLLFTSFLTIALAGGIGIGLIVGSDFCSGGEGAGSPTDTIITAILEHDPTVPGTYYFEGVKWMLKEKCMGPNPLPFPAYNVDLRAAIESSDTFISEVERIGEDPLRATCGSSALEETLALSKDLRQTMNKLVKLSDALSGPNGALTCETLMPIYDEAINETACSDSIGYGIYGFALVSAVAVSSLIMIACRPLPDLISDKCGEDDVVKELDLEENEENDKDMAKSDADETNSNTNSAQEVETFPESKSIVAQSFEAEAGIENTDGSREDEPDDANETSPKTDVAVETSSEDKNDDAVKKSEDASVDLSSDDKEEGSIEKPLDVHEKTNE